MKRRTLDVGASDLSRMPDRLLIAGRAALFGKSGRPRTYKERRRLADERLAWLREHGLLTDRGFPTPAAYAAMHAERQRRGVT